MRKLGVKIASRSRHGKPCRLGCPGSLSRCPGSLIGSSSVCDAAESLPWASMAKTLLSRFKLSARVTRCQKPNAPCMPLATRQYVLKEPVDKLDAGSLAV